ncbi:MAG: A/G-specific adenine glycosylase [Geminicoccaceae bacterium]|nr:A/G-specific adenine glycosylase [Geminicoccaceae bacterium]
MRSALLAWYDATRRALPWRAPPGVRPDPWAVLVSEVMLQQTTAATVARRFPLFVQRFPTPAALAGSSLEEVLVAWQGLGYYRRARSLHACAQRLVAEHDGRVPDSLDALRALPGLGAYTAAAVAAIAFDRPVLPVDGNVARVGARLLGLALPADRVRAPVAAGLAPLAHGERPGDVAQALMELGALVCRPRAPSCSCCPVRGFCRAAESGRARDIPARPSRRAVPVRSTMAFFLRRADGAILFRRRPDDVLLGGMIELPSSPWGEERSLDEHLAHAPAPGPWEPLPGEVRHRFTHFELRVRLARGTAEVAPSGFWLAPETLSEVPVPTLTRKLLARLGVVVPHRGR